MTISPDTIITHSQKHYQRHKGYVKDLKSKPAIRERQNFGQKKGGDYHVGNKRHVKRHAV